MSEITGPLTDITEEAARIIEAAHAEGFPLRLLGGLAVYFQCPSAKSDQRLTRPYKDMDFATLSKWSSKTRSLFTTLGYTANKNFNALHGHQRLLFWDPKHERQVDIFIDRMQMCHSLDLRSRLHIDNRTLSLSDLLISKLQIVEINEKDITDIITLFQDHDVKDSEQAIDLTYISSLTSSDWGLHKTLILNLEKMKVFGLEHKYPAQVMERIDRLIAAMEGVPKSIAWKARSIVGERVRWYELPEETR
ncbi:MAG: hypothetical protein ACJ788_15615 [Ktedonobacteraceae bacterium]